ncbi:MAG: hypothetical protein V1704_02045 [Candidatus Vogelbacteria bacterium]
MEQAPKNETPETGIPFENLRNDMETSHAQLADLVREGEETKEKTLDSFEEQIELMRQLGVSEELVTVFDNDLIALRNEGKSWSSRIVDFKDKLVSKVQEWFATKQQS